jgi:capsular exopolysaccharide synthesis family protein
MNDLRASLLVLRKYWLLLAGVFVVVIAAGFLYGRSLEPTYVATATVQIKQRPGTFLGGSELWIEEDRKFLSDQVYRIRQDSDLALRVVERIRSWSKAGELPPAWSKDVDAAELARTTADLKPESLTGRVTVKPVEETSYYTIGVTGGDIPRIVAIANAYAEETVDLFREENLRAVRSQVEGWEKEWLDRRDLSRNRLAALRGDLSRAQEQNPGVDGARRTNPALLELESARRTLFEVRDALADREESLRSAAAVMQAEGLSFSPRDPDAKGPVSVLHLHAAGEAADPRLSPAIQALPSVARDEEVRRVRDQLRAQEDLDRSLAGGTNPLRENALERQAVRRRAGELKAALALQTEAALCGLDRAVEEEKGRVARIEARVKELDGTAREGSVVLARMEEIDRRIGDVQREIDSYDVHLAEATRLRKAVIEAGVQAQDLVRKIQDARVPAVARVAPDQTQILAFTILAAVAAVLGVLYLLQSLDDTVKSRDDFDRLVRGLPLLGVVPAIPASGEGEVRLVALDGQTGTPAVESFRALRTTLQHTGNGKGARVVLLTSSGPQEGKTTISANLAASFARGGHRTLLVDGDLRRPRVHTATGRENLVGLSSVLSGEASLRDAVSPSPGEPNLFVLPSGPIPPDPSELLSGPRLKATIEEACRTYDRVLIDSPPIVSVTDPCILAQHADVVVLVIAHGRTSTLLIRRARESLEAVGSKAHGAVINNASPGRGFYGDAYYRYAYRYHTYGEETSSRGRNGSVAKRN